MVVVHNKDHQGNLQTQKAKNKKHKKCTQKTALEDKD